MQLIRAAVVSAAAFALHGCNKEEHVHHEGCGHHIEKHEVDESKGMVVDNTETKEVTEEKVTTEEVTEVKVTEDKVETQEIVATQEEKDEVVAKEEDQDEVVEDNEEQQAEAAPAKKRSWTPVVLTVASLIIVGAIVQLTRAYNAGCTRGQDTLVKKMKTCVSDSVNDSLKMVKIHAGKLSGLFNKKSVNKTIENTADQVNKALESGKEQVDQVVKNLESTVNTPVVTDVLETGKEQVKQVVDNLESNVTKTAEVIEESVKQI